MISEPSIIRHMLLWQELTLIRAMIQKAYETLDTTTPLVCRGCWEMLGSTTPCLAMLLCRCCRLGEDDVLSVQLTPWTQLSSVRKGSATRGLISAPRPIKKCKAYGERRTQSWKPYCPLIISRKLSILSQSVHDSFILRNSVLFSKWRDGEFGDCRRVNL